MHLKQVVLRLPRPETSKYLFRTDRSYATVKDIVTVNLLQEFRWKEATFSFLVDLLTDPPNSRGSIPQESKAYSPLGIQEQAAQACMEGKPCFVLCNLFNSGTPATGTMKEFGLMSHFKSLYHAQHWLGIFFPLLPVLFVFIYQSMYDYICHIKATTEGVLRQGLRLFGKVWVCNLK